MEVGIEEFEMKISAEGYAICYIHGELFPVVFENPLTLDYALKNYGYEELYKINISKSLSKKKGEKTLISMSDLKQTHD